MAKSCFLPKTLHLKCLTEFWIWLWFGLVELCMYIYKTSKNEWNWEAVQIQGGGRVQFILHLKRKMWNCNSFSSITWYHCRTFDFIITVGSILNLNSGINIINLVFETFEICKLNVKYLTAMTTIKNLTLFPFFLKKLGNRDTNCKHDPKAQ